MSGAADLFRTFFFRVVAGIVAAVGRYVLGKWENIRKIVDSLVKHFEMILVKSFEANSVVLVYGILAPHPAGCSQLQLKLMNALSI